MMSASTKKHITARYQPRCKQLTTLQDHGEHGTIIHNADVLHDDDDYIAIDSIAEGTSIQLEKSITELLPTNDVTIPTEKIGCIFVARHLQQFLEGHPPPSDKQAFLDVYHMLSLLDKYLSDNPKQYTHCLSFDNEYVALLKYVICLNIDLTTFAAVWAVLSILLDTQGGNLENVKLLQEEYNGYYKRKLRNYMSCSEEIQGINFFFIIFNKHRN